MTIKITTGLVKIIGGVSFITPFPPIWVTAAGSLGDMTEDVSSTFSVEATDQNKNGYITYSIISGSLPGGLSLESNTGSIIGTPSDVSTPETANFTIRATGRYRDFTDRAFSMIVNPSVPPSWVTDADLGSIQHSGNVSIQLEADDPTQTVTYAVFSGTLPGTVTLSTAGLLSGDAGEPGTTTVYNFTIRATDNFGSSADRAFSLTVLDPIAVSFTTNSSYVVPDDITTITVKSWGAGGGGGQGTSSIGGGCGFAQADISVTPGETLLIKIGGGGANAGTAGTNGGGTGANKGGAQGGGGGGYTGLFRTSVSQANCLVLAGGGGGGGQKQASPNVQQGGSGGGTTGNGGGANSPGQGGTQVAGGAAGSGGTAGTSLQGGNGGSNSTYGAAGGGGGYYGGGGGGSGSTAAGGGGGGSGYVTGTNTTLTNGQGYNDTTPGAAANTGDGDYDGIAGVGVTSGSNGARGLMVINA